MIKKKWRRELSPAEKRVNVKELGEAWNSAEAEFVDSLTPILNQALNRLASDIKVILESEDYSALKDVKVGYRDKLVNAAKQNMLDAYRIGKSGVFEELKIDKPLVIDKEAKKFFTTKAEIIVQFLQNRMLSEALFMTMAGIRENKSIPAIMADIKGKK